jgi:hypothetical protein
VNCALVVPHWLEKRYIPISDAIEALVLVWEASTAEEWVNQIMSIPF